MTDKHNQDQKRVGQKQNKTDNLGQTMTKKGNQGSKDNQRTIQ